ncbi:hypothetical protein SAMN05660199_03189 [Klenkia soli]|uniref:Uncharacterized protein n=1 Tax=Klenkia soli TaxID=1052260 RepID=A0A1H0Q4M4_9ACTN|nr:hypothetical protein [Klenkia soli]SDP11569.1 hypothetical protein SAMN05660199_03189 [Klenkia soli]
MDEFGVVRGQVCPQCGIEDAVPVAVGMPDAELARAADRGLAVIAGCVVVDDRGGLHCRACSHEWGSVDDPTADELILAALLAVGHDDVVQAIGPGWRQVGDDVVGLTWFVSGEPAQVAVGVGAGALVIGPAREDLAVVEDEGRTFSRDDLLCSPEWLAAAADEFARARRRSFRWCPTCRRPHPPEEFAGYRGVCVDCVRRHHGLGR